MQKNLTLNFREIKQKSIDLKSIFFENHIRILIITVYLIGLWVGTTLFAKNDAVSDITLKCLDYLINSEYLKTFMILLTVKSITVVSIFFSGFSVFGLPVSISLPCLYGIICGAVNSCIYNTYKLNGVFFSLIVIIPFAVVTALIITRLSDNAICLSKQLVKSVALGESAKRGDAKRYLITGLTVVGAECLIILLQAFLISKPGEMILSL